METPQRPCYAPVAAYSDDFGRPFRGKAATELSEARLGPPRVNSGRLAPESGAYHRRSSRETGWQTTSGQTRGGEADPRPCDQRPLAVSSPDNRAIAARDVRSAPPAVQRLEAPPCAIAARPATHPLIHPYRRRGLRVFSRHRATLARLPAAFLPFCLLPFAFRARRQPAQGVARERSDRGTAGGARVFRSR